jgi:hypothetical protein
VHGSAHHTPDAPLHTHTHTQAALAKAGLHCLSQVLSALDPANWPAAVAPWTMLLSFALDNRPKVRKRSHTGVFEVLAALQVSCCLSVVHTSTCC